MIIDDVNDVEVTTNADHGGQPILTAYACQVSIIVIDYESLSTRLYLQLLTNCLSGKFLTECKRSKRDLELSERCIPKDINQCATSVNTRYIKFE